MTAAAITGRGWKRMFLIEKGIELVNALFRLMLRVSDDWPKELAAA